MLDFLIGLACGITLTMALVVIDAKLGRARREAKLAEARRAFMLDLTADDYSELPPEPYENFIVRQRSH